jgi:DNA-binding CsgD family transcriptional regulator
VEEIRRLWPDDDRRDAGLQRLLERVAAAPGGIQPRPADLTPAEIRCLTCASHGLDAQEIGDTLGCGLESVKTHLKLARRRLAAKNTVHAVAICLRAGLIQ